MHNTVQDNIGPQKTITRQISLFTCMRQGLLAFYTTDTTGQIRNGLYVCDGRSRSMGHYAIIDCFWQCFCSLILAYPKDAVMHFGYRLYLPTRQENLVT